jgi:hypothetical protein
MARLIKHGLLLLLVGAGISLGPPRADAGFSVVLDNFTSSSSTVKDNGKGDQNSATGVISLGSSATLGTTQLSGSPDIVATSNRTTKAANDPGQVALNTVTLTNTGTTTQTFRISIEDDGFTTPGSAGTNMVGQSTFTLNTSLGAGDSVSNVTTTITFSKADGSDKQVASTPVISNGTPGTSYSTVHFTREGKYDIVTSATFTLEAGHSVTFSTAGEVAHAPAPAGVVLLLIGVACLGLGRWLVRRSPRQAVAA